MKKHNLNEAFQSNKLRKLVKFLPSDLSAIATEFGIEFDKITDDQVQVVTGDDAKKLMKKNPNLIGFFIWVGDSGGPRGLMGVKKGGKFISFTTTKTNMKKYYDRETSLNPKHITNHNSKTSYFNSDTGIRGTIGSARGQGAFSSQDFYSEDAIVYLIDINNSSNTVRDKQQNRKTNRDIFYSYRVIADANKVRYKRALSKIRETRNPEFIAQLKAELDEISNSVMSATKAVLSNPQKFRWTPVDREVFANRQTYTTSLLKLTIEAYGNLDDVIKEYKSGDPKFSNLDQIKKSSYGYSSLQSSISAIKKIVSKIEDKANS